MLTEAISFLKGAAPKSGAASFYTFHEGWCFAQSPALLAAYPVPELQGTFGLAAAQLEAALARFAREPEVSSTAEGSLVLKAGRLRATLVPVFADPPEGTLPEDIEWHAAPTGLCDALSVCLAFASKEGAQWMQGVSFGAGFLAAMNQQAFVHIDVPLTAEHVLTRECVEFVVRAGEPSEVAFSDSAVWFKWNSGGWVRAQLSVYPWPDDIVTRFTTEQETPFAISDEFREAFKDAAALSDDGDIRLTPEGFIAKFGSMNVDVSLKTGVENTSKWSAAVLEPMLKIADRWNPNTQIARFEGKNLRGMVAAKR